MDDEPMLWPKVHVSDLSARHAPKDLNPDQLGWNQSCYHYTRDTYLTISGSRETRTHKSRSRPPVFKTGSSSSRMASVCKLRELESNQRPPGSAETFYRPRPSFLAHREAASVALPTATIPHRSCSMALTRLHGSRRAAGAGVEPADPWFKATYFYRQKLPRNQSTRGTGGTRTHALVLNRHLLCR